MHSNNNSVNPHQLPPTFYQYSSSTPFISHDADNNNILFHYYHHRHPLSAQLVPQPFLCPESSAAAAAATLAALSDNPTAPAPAPAIKPVPEKVVKRDRHSKIFTARGLRDRRVRLSTEIARQFFDLQDMLGYDKASETIAWLLMKCRKDIKKLVETEGNTSRGAVSLSPISESEMVPESYEVVEDGDLDGLLSQDESLEDSSKEKRKKTFRGSLQQIGKASREKARAKALERTREKMCTEEMKFCPKTTHHIFEAGEKFCPLKGIAEIGDHSTDPIANQLPREEIMGESIVIRRKMKQTSGLGYPNWDINDANSAPSCYPTATMNLSTELLMSGKPWEVCNNHRLME